MVALAEWAVEQIKRIPQSDDEQYFERALDVYNRAIRTFSDLIGEGCKEQGAVLTGIWTEYQRLVKARVTALRKRTQEKEAEINQLSCSLLGKVENRFKECQSEIDALRAAKDKLLLENEKLHEMVRDYEHDTDKLFAKCATLRTTNDRLKKTVADISRNNLSLKTILIKCADDNTTQSKFLSLIGE